MSIKTWKDLRDHQVEKQDQDYSCGTAAVATLLRYFSFEQLNWTANRLRREWIGLDRLSAGFLHPYDSR